MTENTFDDLMKKRFSPEQQEAIKETAKKKINTIKEKRRNAKPLVKPCPFCHSGGLFRNSVEVVEKQLEYSVAYTFRCKECGGQGAFKTTEDEARSFWNRRGKLERGAKLVSRTKPTRGTKGCILSSGGDSPHFRVYRKHNPPKLRQGLLEPDVEFVDYYLDLDFLFDLWMEIDEAPMEYKEYLQPDGTKIKILGYTEHAWKGGEKYPDLKPGETQIIDSDEEK